MTRRRIFIGDIHGCYEEFLSLIKKVNIKTEDEVILVGDLINKGPLSYEVVSHVYQESNFNSILGNHEYYYLKNNFLNSNMLNRPLEKEKRIWLKNLKKYILKKEYLVIHGGIPPKIPLKKVPLKTLVTLREYQGRAWHEFYKDEKKIIYGHWARQGLMIKKNSIGLDSGCVYGGWLSAYILEEDIVVQVKAKKKYFGY